jgi:hypothetical protein
MRNSNHMNNTMLTDFTKKGHARIIYRYKKHTMNKILIMLFFLIPTLVFSQNKPIPISVSLFNESTAIPYTRFFTTPIHPGLQLGTEFNYINKEHSRLFQTANICYFYHHYLTQGIGLYSELGYEYRMKFGLAFQGQLGLGYMHTFAVADEYTFSNGHYEKKTDKGNARLFPSLSFDISYYIKKSEKNSPEIFVRYQSWLEYPYSPDFIPVMTHINLHIGAKFFINKKIRRNE